MIITNQLITVGLIEDQKLARVGITTILQGYPGLQLVGEAVTAKAGLDLALSQRPQVMIVDLGLPDMDGIELIRKLRALLPELVIVILTVHDREQIILDALMAGANAYCLKENISDQLGQVIENVYKGGAWLDRQVAQQVVQRLIECQSITGKHIEDSLLGVANEKNSYNLTEREQQVLDLLTQGKSNGSIAEMLNVSYHTVKSDMTQLMLKLGVQDRTQAVIKALKENLIRNGK